MFLSFWAKTESNFGGFFNLLNVKDYSRVQSRKKIVLNNSIIEFLELKSCSDFSRSDLYPMNHTFNIGKYSSKFYIV